jgi:hypothetical protein
VASLNSSISSISSSFGIGGFVAFAFVRNSYMLFIACPPSRGGGRDLYSKMIDQTAALPSHTPAHFAAGVS